MVHMGQLYRDGKFQKFDYGFVQNGVRYGQLKPPEARLEDIKVPVVMVLGKHDQIADLRDNLEIKKRIPNLVDFRLYEDEDHMSLQFSKNMTYF